jgi:hypothetical protein
MCPGCGIAMLLGDVCSRQTMSCLEWSDAGVPAFQFVPRDSGSSMAVVHAAVDVRQICCVACVNGILGVHLAAAQLTD